ncbi:tyrosine-type recombinase/integrase [Saccharopolyspora sp. NFXS83]|uniref:tyrosine-type recombinase/integrase n=1 Tax=Saccharopolyspora sp. NFXS83 TaxID=2993560 RepID=UPI00224B1FF8|nr:tyrosine-type recombinase/integrase [Saccharopolyspora sp. NFXS83]MCX2728933.1 tyrosine-type recombinase/integrase [Saccharopolyspora sp. NFXS83]
MSTTYKVRIYKTRQRKNREGKTTSYQVRWEVEGTAKQESFKLSAQADSFRSDLISSAKKGEAFDVRSGLPVRLLRVERSEFPWLPFAQDFADMKWPNLAPKSRKSLVDGLVAISTAMLVDEHPDPKLLNRALRRSLNPSTREAPASEDAQQTTRWFVNHSRKVEDLADPEAMRTVLRGLEKKQDGTPAAHDTVRLRRTTLRDAIGYAIEKTALTDNPLEAVKGKRPTARLRQVDSQSVANPVQARTLLLAVKEKSPRLTAFFAVMYFAALRPEEATNLRKNNLLLPAKGWGELHLTAASPEIAADYSDNGVPNEERSLKHREDFTTRTVPCPPELTAHLQQHLRDHGTGKGGRLFWGTRSRERLSSTVYGRAWANARTATLVPAVASSSLARRPYDLRHAAVSTWLTAGVEPTRVAAWAGHSVSVLLRVYAKCLDGGEQAARDRVGAALGPWPGIGQN